MQKQNIQHIDKNITNVFHFLELKSNHGFLIGSNSIKHVLYANDYDLNENIKMNDSVKIISAVYKQFVDIFNKAYKTPEYYITDFKNGMFNGLPIRWEYEDIKKGTRTIDNHTFTFGECLLHDNNLVKLDLCYAHNNLFTDINIIYNFIINNVNKIDSKIEEQFDKQIEEARMNGDYYKVIKRKFNKELNHGKVNKGILNLMNSGNGIMYKSITSLKLVKDMLIQTFKPISNKLIKINLEHIKQNTSKITNLDVTEYLDDINDLIKDTSQEEMILDLDIVINHMEYYFNQKLKKRYDYVIFGGAMNLNNSTLHKLLDSSYGIPTDTNGYVLDTSLSGSRSQVYYHPEKDHLVIAHRGTKGLHDVGTDIKLMLGYKNNRRFNHGRKITDQAIDKYKTAKNTSIIGHSLAGEIAHESNKGHNKEVITLNPAVVPSTMFRKQKNNEHLIRDRADPISFLHTLNPRKNKKNTYILDSGTYNPLKTHSTDILKGAPDDTLTV